MEWVFSNVNNEVLSKGNLGDIKINQRRISRQGPPKNTLIEKWTFVVKFKKKKKIYNSTFKIVIISSLSIFC